jgi:hypothetical protein
MYKCVDAMNHQNGAKLRSYRTKILLILASLTSSLVCEMIPLLPRERGKLLGVLNRDRRAPFDEDVS